MSFCFCWKEGRAGSRFSHRAGTVVDTARGHFLCTCWPLGLCVGLKKKKSQCSLIYILNIILTEYVDVYLCVCVCVCLCGLCVLSHPSHVRLCNPMDCSLLGSSVHVILPGRKLEWVAMPSSRGSDQGIKPASPALQENSLLLSHGETKYIHQFSSVQFSLSLVSDSLQPQESQHARPPCPSPSPGVHSDSCPSSQ